MALGKGLGSLIAPHKSKSIRKDDPTQSDRVWYIPLSEIVPNPEQPRKHFAHQDLEDLVASIKEHGILQPLLVSEKEDGGYELIAGERRFRASQIAQLPTVPALVRPATEQQKLEFALIENIQRQALNPVEEGFAYQRLIDSFGLTQQDVADRVGKSRPVVANTIRLLDLPDVIQKALVDGQLSTGKARALLSLKSTEDQLRMFQQMMGMQVNVRDVERLVADKGAASRKGSVRRDPNLLAQERALEESLGTKIRITQKGERGKIEIEYFSREELKRLVEELSA